MFNYLDLVILAGGKGSRLKEITRNTPKPLIKINGIPFIQYLLNQYSKYYFRNIYILAGYKGYKIKKQFHKKTANLIPIHCSIEKKMKGTGGALFILKNKIKSNFILINGDSFFDYNISLLNNFKLNSNLGSMILIKNKIYKENQKLSKLGIDRNKFVINNSKSCYMNSGVYLFSKKIFKYISNKYISLEDEILPKLIKKRRIKGIYSNGYFMDIGTKKNLILARKQFKKQFKRPAIFLDRDGVINEDKGHVYKIKDFKYTKKIFSALRKIKNHYIFIITNQAGIGKGLYGIDDFLILHNKIKQDFIKNKLFLNDVKFCPHHPDATVKKFKKKCQCRKPGNKMIQDILRSWNIDTKKSIMIGDKKSDEIAAKKSKIEFQYIDKNIEEQINKFIKN